MPHNTWSDAMFTQAKQDFYLAALGSKHLPEEEEESFDATICMLLQMFFEKYAKAVYHLQTGEFPPKKHKTAKIFLDTLRGSAKYCKMKKKPFFVYCCNCIEKLEKLQPANAKELKGMDKSPQLEYPWSEDGVFFSPAKDLDLVKELRKEQSPIITRLFPFAKNLINDFPF
jgi:hypothetical protein